MVSELPVPPDAKNDPKARELIRVWSLSSGECCFLINPDFPDVAQFGVLIADLIRQISNMKSHKEGVKYEEYLSKTVGNEMAELLNPTECVWGINLNYEDKDTEHGE